MNDLAAMQELFAYTAWADAIVWTAVLSDAGACTDVRVRDCLFHIHMAQSRYLRIWHGEPLEPMSNDAPDLATTLGSARSTHERIASFLDGLNETSLGADVMLPFAARVAETVGKEPGVSTMGDTLLQVVNHSTYHRGQTDARLRELGGTPPLTDFIVWVLLGKPAASWPTRDAERAPN